MAIALESGLGVDVDRARLLAVALTVALAYGLREGATRLWYRRHWDREYGRETWELENYERGEREEMVGLWIFKGLRRSDAESVIDTLSGYKKFFVGLMMTEELRMFEPNARELAEVAVLTALITLGAVGPLLAGGLAAAAGLPGSLPGTALGSYGASPDGAAPQLTALFATTALATMALAWTGGWRASFSRLDYTRHALESAAVGFACLLLPQVAAAAFAG